MQAIIPDKRRKRGEIPVVCCECGFPQIEGVYEGGSKYNVELLAKGPQSEEEALETGWLATELGIICPLCAGLQHAQEARDEAEGSESHVGVGQMATALAQGIAETQGEKLEERIEDSEVPLPEIKPDVTLAVHHKLQIDGEQGAESAEGTATCARCGKQWKFAHNLETDEYTTEPAYDPVCAYLPEDDVRAGK